MLQFNFSPFPELKTERLLLRKVTEKDAPAIFLLRSDETVLKYLCKEPAESIESVKTFICQVENLIERNESVLWGITYRNKPDDVIGTICLWQLQPENHRGEIGYVLNPNFWGMKIMKEAMNAVLNYGFAKMNLHSVVARLSPDNIASTHLLEKAGFNKEAYFKEDILFRGKFLDTVVYSKIGEMNIRADTY